MLIRYKKNSEKIAMGLLSFMPEEKEVRKLQETIQKYEENPNWHLYLWKEDDDVLGLIGLRIEKINAVIQHISVDPSHRNSGIGKSMVHEIQKMYQEQYAVCANHLVQQFYNKCEENNGKKKD
ncbi:MAG TPA: GNAT family N-acetyltransferase [Bacillota bacterium]